MGLCFNPVPACLPSPLLCSSPALRRFTNEDHLAVHKHKHEMTLKFGPARTDSTPTPTRFLKNCEEVGLFNELASSFEHEFKKAAEDDEKKARRGHPGWEHKPPGEPGRGRSRAGTAPFPTSPRKRAAFPDKELLAPPAPSIQAAPAKPAAPGAEGQGDLIRKRLIKAISSPPPPPRARSSSRCAPGSQPGTYIY
uniref:Cyclic AMP-dependent transcription factor ATF-7 n=1 Tax=Zosterops lateralis melanops TaxID=1220523 RepID=A0A8D2Q368_ZOSLA